MILMLRFGKKVNLRPLMVSVAIAFLPGYLFGILFSISIGLLTGFCFFSAIFLYYYVNLPSQFCYWQFDGKNIEYDDINDSFRRLITMFFPHFYKMSMIKKEQVRSIKLLGNIEDKENLPFMVPVSNAYSLFSTRLSMIKNPTGIEVTTMDNNKIYLDVSRDYTYDNKKTIKKINKFLANFS